MADGAPNPRPADAFPRFGFRDGGTEPQGKDTITIGHDSFLRRVWSFLPWAKTGNAENAAWEVDRTLASATMLPPLSPTLAHRNATSLHDAPGFIGFIESELTVEALSKFGNVLYEAGALTKKHDTWQEWLATLKEAAPAILARQPDALKFDSNDLYVKHHFSTRSANC